MSLIIKIIALCFLVAFVNPILKKNNPEFALAVTVGASVILFGLLTGIYSKAAGKIREIADMCNISADYIGIIIKIILIAYLCEYCAAVIEDSGEKAIAKKIELSGKIVIFIMAFPILSELFSGVVSIIR